MSFRTTLLVLATLTSACVPAEYTPHEDTLGQVWGGGSMTVTFYTETGLGIDGTVEVAGTDIAILEEEGLWKNTGLHAYPWLDGHDFELSATANEDTDFSVLSQTLACTPEIDFFQLQLSYFDVNWMSAEDGIQFGPDAPGTTIFVVDDWYRHDPIQTWYGEEVIPVTWVETPAGDCDNSNMADSVGTGTITVSWELDPDQTFEPPHTYW